MKSKFLDKKWKISIFILFFLIVMVLCTIIYIRANTYISWNSLKEIDISSNGSVYDFSNNKTYRNQTVNVTQYPIGNSYYDNVQMPDNTRLEYMAKFKVNSGQVINIFGATNDTNLIGGVDNNNGKTLYWSIGEYDANGNLLYDGDWRETNKSWNVGKQENSGAYGADGYALGVSPPSRERDVAYITVVFRWNDGNLSYQGGSAPINQNEFLNVFKNLYLCFGDFTYNFDANGGTVSPTSIQRLGITPKSSKKITATFPTPTRSGYRFVGWKVVSSTNKRNMQLNQSYVNDQVLTNGKFYSSFFGDATLQAQWEDISSPIVSGTGTDWINKDYDLTATATDKDSELQSISITEDSQIKDKATAEDYHRKSTYIYDEVDYSLVFDAQYYANTYPDLASLSTQQLLWHFLNYGMNEGRQGSINFNLQTYKTNNPDIVQAYGSNNKEYYTHYINYGASEWSKGRKACDIDKMESMVFTSTKIGIDQTVYNGVDYEKVFNPVYYAMNNSDVVRIYKYDNLLKHFVTCGISEGRRGSSNFDLQTYKDNNKDLVNAFGSDNNSYYNHYINYGAGEGRISSEYNKLNYTVTNEGIHNLTISATDYYGNKGEKKVAVLIDKSAPVISCQEKVTIVDGAATAFNASATDQYSGMKSLKLYDANGKILASGDAALNYSFTQVGKYYIVALDKVDNSSQKEVNVSALSNTREVTVNHYVMNTSGSYSKLPDLTENLDYKYGDNVKLSDLVSAKLQVPGQIVYSYGTVNGEKKTQINVADTPLTINLYYSRTKHIVTYNVAANGGKWSDGTTANKQVSVCYGADIDLTNYAGVRNYYNFIGWNTNSKANTGLSKLKMVDKDITLYALYTSNTSVLTIEHYVMDENGKYPDLPTKAETGKGILGDKIVPKSYKSSDLEVSDQIVYKYATVNDKATESCVIDQKKTVVKLYYERKQHTVTYDVSTNGGKWADGSTTNKQLSVYYGANIDLTNYSGNKNNYEFVGWNTASKENVGIKTLQMKDKDITLYAIYKCKIGVVKVNHYVMNMEGGYDSTPTKTENLNKEYGTVLNHADLQDKTLIVPGGIEFDSDKSKGPTTVTGDVEINLYYKRLEHKVAYNVSANGGTWSGGITNDREITLLYGANISLDDFSGLKSNAFVFIGWNTQSDTHTGYKSQTEWKNAHSGAALTVGTSDMTLFAVYKKDITTTFVDCAGSKYISVTIYNNTTSTTIDAPAITAYTQWQDVSDIKAVGYNTAENITADKATQVQVKDGEKNLSVSDSKTYYAVYSADITISYVLNGGIENETTKPLTKTIYCNAYNLQKIKSIEITLAECQKPTYDDVGYIHSFLLAVWAENSEDGEKYNSNAKYTLDKNTVMYALWDETVEPITYHIAFDGMGAQSGVPDTITAHYDEDVLIPAQVPERTAFNFLSWNTREDGMGTEISTGDTVRNMTTVRDSTVTLYAQWKQKRFQLVKASSTRYNATIIKRTDGDESWYDSVGKLNIEQLGDYSDEDCVQVWNIDNTGAITRTK